MSDREEGVEGGGVRHHRAKPPPKPSRNPPPPPPPPNPPQRNDGSASSPGRRATTRRSPLAKSPIPPPPPPSHGLRRPSPSPNPPTPPRPPPPPPPPPRPRPTPPRLGVQRPRRRTTVPTIRSSGRSPTTPTPTGEKGTVRSVHGRKGGAAGVEYPGGSTLYEVARHLLCPSPKEAKRYWEQARSGKKKPKPPPPTTKRLTSRTRTLPPIPCARMLLRASTPS